MQHLRVRRSYRRKVVLLINARAFPPLGALAFVTPPFPPPHPNQSTKTHTLSFVYILVLLFGGTIGLPPPHPSGSVGAH